MSKKIYIRRLKIGLSTWFEIVGCRDPFGGRILVDFPGLLILQDLGVEVNDIDAIRMEQVRNN